MIEITPSGYLGSIAIGVEVITTSLIIPFGNIGLMARSVSLAFRIAWSEAFHSLLL
jgi:hypothetical protein